MDDTRLEKLSQLWQMGRKSSQYQPEDILELPVQLVRYLVETGKITVAELHVLDSFFKSLKGKRTWEVPKLMKKNYHKTKMQQGKRQKMA